MRIININGPINSGKSTIAKLLIRILPRSLFIEVDDLLSDEEQDRLGLSMQAGWAERTNRLNAIIQKEKSGENYQNIIFAYPITAKLYKEWQAWEDGKTTFINITLSPKLEVCLQNRGTRELDDWEIKRIKEMYQEGYQHPEFSDLIIDNGEQTPQETVHEIINFLEQRSGNGNQKI